ncbi:MAG: thiamine-monophosphate kinase [Candidatus Hodarchaeota archaeon]
MKAMEKILENVMIDSWVRYFSRAPHQINKLHEADAELIEIKGDDSQLLAITIDSVAEEITEGLYQDPFTMGWVTVMSNFSDLAVVGAEPLGIVISVSIEPTRSKTFCQGIAQGMAAACQKLGVFILGGDTNTTRTISLTGCAIGLVPRDQKVTRIGCRVGDVVFLSGSAGSGSAIGLMRLAKLPEEYFPESSYRPIARIKEGQLIRNYATCCMDTSDGVLATLDQLMRLNGVGFVLEPSPEEFLHPDVWQFSKAAQIPAWMMLAGPHGEFELLFTVPPERVETLLANASLHRWKPIYIGKVVEEPEIKLKLYDELTTLETGRIRNLFIEVKGNANEYVKELIRMDAMLGANRKITLRV